jgi:hypothetical protein
VHTTDHAASVAASSTTSSAADPAAGRERISLLLLAAIVLLPLLIVTGIGIFHNAGNDGAAPVAGIDTIAWPPRGTAPPASPGNGAAPVDSVDSMIVGLERRLEREPDDAKGWALLAQSYAFLGRQGDAETAMAKAVARGFGEADLRQRVSLAAREAAGAGQGNLLPDSPVIHGTVKLAAAGPLQLAPGSRLFVTAKATDGSPVPVAVLGEQVTEFPFQFVLGDKDAMMPGVRLSDYEEIAVSARLSQSGTADRSPGDLESAITIVRVGEPGQIDLVIEKR